MPDSFIPDSFTADAPPPPQLRSRTGALYTPPADSGLKDFAQGVVDAVNPMSYLNALRGALSDPMGAAGNLLMAPVRMVGDLVTQPAHTLGNLSAGLAVGAALPAVGAVRDASTPYAETLLAKTLGMDPTAIALQ